MHFRRMSFTTNIQATVLLNANVAFLAVPLVVNNASIPNIIISNSTVKFDYSTGQGNQPLPPAAVASQISILASLACIILGLLLLRQHRTKARETPNDAVSVHSIDRHFVNLKPSAGCVSDTKVTPEAWARNACNNV